MYSQDLTGVGWVGALLESLARVKRKSVPSSSHTALAAVDCPFHSGFMSFCIISMDYEMCSDPGDTSALQNSLALTFTTKDSKALNLTALRFILRFSAIPTST